MSNNCTNLALLKNNCAVYSFSASAVSVIERVLKISLSNANAEDRKFEVTMTSLPLTYAMPRYLLDDDDDDILFMLSNIIKYMHCTMKHEKETRHNDER